METKHGLKEVVEVARCSTLRPALTKGGCGLGFEVPISPFGVQLNEGAFGSDELTRLFLQGGKKHGPPMLMFGLLPYLDQIYLINSTFFISKCIDFSIP